MNHKRITYTREQLQSAVDNSLSVAQVLTKIGLAPRGGNYRTIKQMFKQWDIDTSHFTGQLWNKGKHVVCNPARSLQEILVKGSTYQSYKLGKRLIQSGLKEHRCECCGNTEWLGIPIPLELHHINGDNTDNRLVNLRMLCPNCHSLTDNYRGKNLKRRD